MQVKRFIAADMRRALDLVRDSLGADAMILSTQRQKNGVELLATLDDPATLAATPVANETITDEGMVDVDTPPHTRSALDEQLPMHSDHVWRDQEAMADATSRFKSASPSQSSPAPQAPLPDYYDEHANRSPDAIGLASGKTPQQLASEIERARTRMLSARKQENMTIEEWSEQRSNRSNRNQSSQRQSSRHTDAPVAAAQETYTGIEHAPSRGYSAQDDGEIQQIKADIAGMRELLETQLQQLGQMQKEALLQSALPSSAAQPVLESGRPLQVLSTPQAQVDIATDNVVTHTAAQSVSHTNHHSSTKQHSQHGAIGSHKVEPISVKATLQQRLQMLGLTSDTITRLLASISGLKESSLRSPNSDAIASKNSTLKILWPEVLAQLASQIPAAVNDPVADGGTFAFLGPTGVGKTTTIAKLAARYVLQHGPENVLLLTTDTYRIAAHDQLRSLGKILNVTVKVVEDLHQLPAILRKTSRYSLVLLDTPGMANADLLLAQHLQMLEQCPHLRSMLVMSANNQHPMLKASLHTYQAANIYGCVLTKLDECASLGGAISALISHRTPLHYITDGQAVPDDLAVIKPHQLLARCLEMTKKESKAGLKAAH